MKSKLQNILLNHPKGIIRDNELTILLNPTSPDARYSVIKRAKKEEWLVQLKKGLYFIKAPYNKVKPNLFEVAQFIYGPSYISLESALSYHQWIPEAVYAITSVSPLRTSHFNTPLGMFSFMHVPVEHFYLGVERIENQHEIFFIATPWRAIADYLYVYKKSWKSLNAMMQDLRVEPHILQASSKENLRELSVHYPNTKVKKQLADLFKEFQT